MDDEPEDELAARVRSLEAESLRPVPVRNSSTGGPQKKRRIRRKSTSESDYPSTTEIGDSGDVTQFTDTPEQIARRRAVALGTMDFEDW